MPTYTPSVQSPLATISRDAVVRAMVTTANGLEGYRVVRTLGVVRGIVVRSRSVVGNLGAAFQMIFGGNISILQSLCEQARGEAFDQMLTHAAQLGANAIIAARYDATEIMQGVSEVLAYGTAVIVESDAREQSYR